jgi:hypothetical protein
VRHKDALYGILTLIINSSFKMMKGWGRRGAMDNIKCIVIISGVCAMLLGAGPSCASDAPAGAERSAQALEEVMARNRMLKAKHEMWSYGTTNAMRISSDGSYVSIVPGQEGRYAGLADR